jgi:hypothetical protein
MSEPDAKFNNRKEPTPTLDEPSSAAYDAWAKAKIEAALSESIEHPEWRVPLDQVWKKFGLDH